jgi:hypothetical protein
VKDKFVCNLCSKVLCNICYNQGIISVARYSISCIRARSQGTLMTNSWVVSATFFLSLRETSSSFVLCIKRRQCDQVIATHGIVSWYAGQVGTQTINRCMGQFIGSEHTAGLLGAITKDYGVFLWCGMCDVIYIWVYNTYLHGKCFLPIMYDIICLTPSQSMLLFV